MSASTTPDLSEAFRPSHTAGSGIGAMLPVHCRDEVLSFAECVVRQVAHPLGAPRVGAAEHDGREHRVAERLGAILRLACGDDGRAAPPDAALDEAAALLAADTPLLSACFQNTDLLPLRGAPAADAVALLVLRAMERLAATPIPPATPGR